MEAAAAQSTEQKQAIRLRSYSLAAFAYLLILPPLWVACAFGFIPAGPAIGISIAMIATNGAIALAFHTGFNLRFRDPSLTKLQVYIGITLLMAGLYYTTVDRGVALGLCFLVFLFGVFRLTSAEFRTLTLYTLAAYAVVVNLIMRLKPEVVASVHQEWFNWLLLAATLPVFGVVGGRISDLRARLHSRNLELREAIGTIETMATRDDVTGLHSRMFFAESLRHALAQADRHSRSVALLMIDVDRFKVVNDSLGHGAGDRLLREIGARIRACVRESDIVARLGGDEFVVVVEAARSPEALREVAHKIVRAASQPFDLDGRELAVTVSVGIATAPDDGADAEALLRCADVALYRMKERGRNGFTFYAQHMSARAEERLAFEAELGRAVERGELRLHFQPKVRIADGAIVGGEALLRWQHPRLGLLAPERFIAIAEETGAIVPIGRWILLEACRCAALWGGPASGLRVAVNLSARQFGDPDLLADIDAALAESGLAAAGLELEVTESMVMQDPEQAATLLATLRTRGIHISMDDFGTGYSSLGYLKRFPFNTVKIDRSFVRDLPHHEDDAAIARAVLAMARSLRLETVAEGVERADQLDFLRREGCTEYQGYHFSVPLADAEFRSLLESRRLKSA